MSKLRLEVLTPEKVALSEEVDTVYLQGSEGRLGILPMHTTLIAKLDFGLLEYTKNGVKKTVLCGAGLLEVNDNEVRVLVRSAEGAEDIDVARAKRSLERAKSRRNSKDKDLDLERANDAYERARGRLRFVGSL